MVDRGRGVEVVEVMVAGETEEGVGEGKGVVRAEVMEEAEEEKEEVGRALRQASFQWGQGVEKGRGAEEEEEQAAQERP